VSARGKYTARFTQYARSLGCGPRLATALDRERFRGGWGAGFIVWVSQRWREWVVETNHPKARDRFHPLFSDDHAAFDAWLVGRVTALLGGAS
jgi:hypothetical protein